MCSTSSSTSGNSIGFIDYSGTSTKSRSNRLYHVVVLMGSTAVLLVVVVVVGVVVEFFNILFFPDYQ